MKIYMHEYALDTSLLFSNDGRVLGVYLDSEDAQDNYDALPVTEFDTSHRTLATETPEDELPLDFDDAA